MASDGPPQRVEAHAQRVSLHDCCRPAKKKRKRIYAALAQGGEVFMKMEETFFAHRFGQFRDKFGINWMVIHEKR